MTRFSFSCMALLVSAASAFGKDLQITVTGGKEDRTNVVVSVPLSQRLIGDARAITVKDGDGKPVAAQLTAARLLAPEALRRNDAGSPPPELVLLLPSVKAGQTLTLTGTLAEKSEAPGFSWANNKDGLPELSFAGRPVLSYFHKPFDVTADKDTTKNPTIKPFHHLYDPTGKVLLTNGVGGSLYPHHRGIFFGCKCIYDGKTADTWHGRPAGVHQSADKVIASEAGPVLGRQRVAIGWHGVDGKVFADEERELTAYQMPGGTLVEFATILRPEVDKVKLDGDPQHAGFHFRANDEVAKQSQAKKPQTYFLRPDGKGKIGETRNWEPKTKKGPVDLPWNAMSFVLGDKRYTVVYLDRPDNPKEARFSERDYGRFGSYFEYELTKDKPLRLNYRLWAQEGEMSVEQCEALSKAFVDPPKVVVAAK